MNYHTFAAIWTPLPRDWQLPEKRVTRGAVKAAVIATPPAQTTAAADASVPIDGKHKRLTTLTQHLYHVELETSSTAQQEQEHEHEQ